MMTIKNPREGLNLSRVTGLYVCSEVYEVSVKVYLLV